MFASICNVNRLEREKREKEREKERERERERDRSRHQPAKRFRGDGSSYGYGPNGYGPQAGYQTSGRVNYGARGWGGYTRGGKQPSTENTCHKCGSAEHFYKQCPNKK